MKTNIMKKLLVPALLSAGLAVSGSAAAAGQVLDAWQLDTTGALATTPFSGGGVTTDIGHLNLSGGTSTVVINTTASGGGATLGVGDTFSELGAIFSISYTTNNVVGPLDSGAPNLFANGLRLDLVYSGLSGTITTFDALNGHLDFAYTPGVGTVTLVGHDFANTTSVNLASFSLVNPSTGQQKISGGGALLQDGTNDVLALVTGSVANLFRDSLGVSLDSLLAANKLFASVQTNNKLGTQTLIGANSLQLTFTSDGSLDLVRSVPEPASVALIGLGLLLLGFSNRSKSGMAA